MRHKFLGMLVGLIIIIGLVTPPQSNAQDDSQLTEEEVSAIDRILTVPDVEAGYHSYTIIDDFSENSEMKINMINTSIQTSTTDSVVKRGYIIKTDTGQNATYDVFHGFQQTRTSYTTDPSISINPYENIQYRIDGELIFVDQIAYANLVYTEATDNAPELTEGWVAFATDDDIPDGYRGLDIANLFDAEISPFYEHPEALLEYASKVIIDQKLKPVADGYTNADIFTVVILDEDFVPYIRLVLVDEYKDSPLWSAIINSDELTGAMSLTAQFTEEGDLHMSTISVDLNIEDLDLFAIMPDDVPEGTTLDLTSSTTIRKTFDEFNQEFDPIVAPE